MRFASGLVALTAAAVVAQMIACGDASGPKLGPPASIVLVSGDGQGTIEAGTKLGQPLTVRVTDSQGQRLSGVVVTWTTASGSLSPSTSSTNADGVATADWTVGTLVGTETATATVTGLQPITFTAITIAGPPTQLIISRDTVQLLGVGDVFRFSARAADRFGNTVLLLSLIHI